MLRVFQSTSASDAKSYFTESLARENYYTEGRDINGLWGGKAASLLGLSGDLDRLSFARLCDNTHPGNGDRLTPRTRDDRTVGYDLTFHAPKGVSVLHALTGDARIVTAMRDAVAETMLELESAVHTRVRLDGKSEDRHTGNLAWGDFVHFTTRPVDGLPDPHLHVHCFVFNATHDPVEDRWKAGQFRYLVQQQPYFEAAYHSRLASKLDAIGYQTARNAHGWDLDGIPRDLVTAFSRRTEQIEKAAKRLGITDAEEKSTLGARTRSKKSDSLSPEELAQTWHERLTPEQAEWLHQVTQRPGTLERGTSEHGTERSEQAFTRDGRPIEPRIADPSTSPTAITPAKALDHAIGHIFERCCVEHAHRLVAEALRYGLGRVSPEAVWAELDQRQELLHRTEGHDRLVTTRAVLAEEKAMLRFAIEGKGQCVPLGQTRDGEATYQVGSLSESQGFSLNDQQTAAIDHLLSSRDRVMLLRGGAGTGKTALLMEAAQAIQRGTPSSPGVKVFACAVTAAASRGVLREAGFARAETLEKLLTDPRLHEQIRGQLVWVDEAGMVGTPTMKRLFDLAAKCDARVVLAGDTKQHPPVERGDAMRILERQAGIKPAEVREIVRQSGMYKDAVEAMEAGELTKSVELLDRMGSIKEIDNEQRHEALAEKYLDATKGRGTALVVSPTHAEGRQVTEKIREQLKSSGRLGEERTFTRLQDTQWTDAEKADPHKYAKGQVVQFTQHCPGVPSRDIPPATAGLRGTVISTDPARKLVLTEDADGVRRPLPLNQASRFAVFEPQPIDIAVGDRIRITRNDHALAGSHRLTNGSMYRVAGFTDEGHIRLGNRGKWEVAKGMGHINHAYCTTPQAAQGKSVDRCFAAMSSESMTASTMQQLYVVLSRGKKSVELMTDKRDALIKAVSRLAVRQSATELIKDDPGKVRESRLVEHAREVQRLKAYEAARKGRGLAQLGRTARGKTRDASRDINDRLNRGINRARGRGRDRRPPGQERER